MHRCGGDSTQKAMHPDICLRPMKHWTACTKSDDTTCSELNKTQRTTFGADIRSLFHKFTLERRYQKRFVDHPERIGKQPSMRNTNAYGTIA